MGLKSGFIVVLMVLLGVSHAKAVPFTENFFQSDTIVRVGNRDIHTNKYTADGTPVVPMWNAPMPNANQSTGAGFPVLSQAQHTMVWQPANKDQGAYNHYACLIFFKGKFFAMWGNHTLGEDAPGQRVLFSMSNSWGNWSGQQELFAAPGPIKPRDEEGIHLKPDRWVVIDNTLYAVTYVHGAGRYPIARSVDENGNIGAPFLVTTLPSGAELPSYMTGTDPNILLPVASQIRSWYTSNDEISWWAAGAEGVPRTGIDGSQLIESFSYRANDNSLVLMLRNWGTPSNPVHNNRMYASFKSGSGSWTSPYPTDIPDAPSRAQAIRLRNGTILLIGNQIAPTFDNALYLDRDPMTVSVSKDGFTFNQVFAYRTAAPTSFRFSGVGGRNLGYGYSSSIVHEDWLYTLYSIGKEDMAISKVHLSEIDPLYGKTNLLTWQFHESNVSVGNEATYIATSLNPAAAGSILKRGDGLKPAGLARGFASSSRLWYSSTGSPTSSIPVTKAMAVADNAFYEFTFSPNPGYKISLTTLRANIRRSSLGCSGYIWKYSKDGVNYIEIPTANEVAPHNFGGTIVQTLDTGNLVITGLDNIPDLQGLVNGTSVTFRLYGWGATSEAGSFSFGRSSITVSAVEYKTIPLILSGNVEMDNTSILAFNLLNASGSEAAYTANASHPNLKPSAITRGTGLEPYVIARSMGSLLRNYQSDTRQTLSKAIEYGDYYEFSVSPEEGYLASLSSLSFVLRRSTYGALKYQWKYSTNGTDFYNIGSYNDIQIPLIGLSQPQINLANIAELQGISHSSSVVFRLYVWGTAMETGTIAIGRYDVGQNEASLIIGGTVETITVLPVKLTSFKARTTKFGTVELNWKTTEEANNSHYEVLRSSDKNFISIGKVAGHGKTKGSSYTFTDQKPFTGVSYYQLRQVDVDGKYWLSDIEHVKNALLLKQLSVYASKQQGKVNVNFVSANEGNAKISIYDVNGRLLHTESIAIGVSSNQFKLSLNSLNTALYVLNIDFKGDNYTVKFIPQ
ncbi:MAG: exo-alpha-sialidase [Pedobacter sp.]|uniref:exo-alpha-sialidase n=1 Tax=Pedobacter sp. TaxID=1411316 RepID=UPI002809A3B1|nr:exo-alpha-sialidase [Pedobacter sp.]MDQ8006054.1 exo-alpha-sialidase [Pedobacter sp.]